MLLTKNVYITPLLHAEPQVQYVPLQLCQNVNGRTKLQNDHLTNIQAWCFICSQLIDEESTTEILYADAYGHCHLDCLIE